MSSNSTQQQQQQSSSGGGGGVLVLATVATCALGYYYYNNKKRKLTTDKSSSGGDGGGSGDSNSDDEETEDKEVPKPKPEEKPRAVVADHKPYENFTFNLTEHVKRGSPDSPTAAEIRRIYDQAFASSSSSRSNEYCNLVQNFAQVYRKHVLNNVTLELRRPEIDAMKLSKALSISERETQEILKNLRTIVEREAGDKLQRIKNDILLKEKELKDIQNKPLGALENIDSDKARQIKEKETTLQQLKQELARIGQEIDNKKKDQALLSHEVEQLKKNLGDLKTSNDLRKELSELKKQHENCNKSAKLTFNKNSTKDYVDWLVDDTNMSNYAEPSFDSLVPYHYADTKRSIRDKMIPRESDLQRAIEACKRFDTDNGFKFFNSSDFSPNKIADWKPPTSKQQIAEQIFKKLFVEMPDQVVLKMSAVSNWNELDNKKFVIIIDGIIRDCKMNRYMAL